MNSYQATFILDTRGYEEPVQTLIDKVRKTLTDLGAEVGEIVELGQKDFARIIDRKFPQGTYVQVPFQSEAAIPAQLNEKFRLDRTVYRIFVETK